MNSPYPESYGHLNENLFQNSMSAIAAVDYALNKVKLNCSLVIFNSGSLDPISESLKTYGTAIGGQIFLPKDGCYIA